MDATRSQGGGGRRPVLPYGGVVPGAHDPDRGAWALPAIRQRKEVKSMKIKVVKVERLKLTCPPAWSDVIVRGCES